ncbi:uncharacterized protein LOC131890641 [Tigriopus californicus]|uniref:uncharacterized protein LOC131890641 n=1 Tax=Tigriopus californicus TaxID=6832 RepID=UPI0027DA6CB4|nr:uncharacterized protein LOC131890641 [Tigriopus californicus]
MSSKRRTGSPTLRAKKDNLAKHEISEGHKSKTRDITSSSKLSFPTVAKIPKCEKLKSAELQIAVAVCCHMSINTIDHLGEVIKKNSEGSTLQDLRLHRTKCSRLIDHVLSPALKGEQTADMAGQPYSLLVDESTDVSDKKNLCLIVKYFSCKTEKVESSYLGLFPVSEATGEALFDTVKAALEEAGLSLKNCIGLGSDGASNMVGDHNSLWSRIKIASPNCILFKCVCHSLALCVEKAFDVLPSHIGFLMAEVSAWFGRSPLWKEEYRAHCKTTEHR